MKKLNNKGFSLVEILVAIALLAVLMSVATQAYNTYKKKARQQAYDTMAKSSTVAATNYLMDNSKAKYITFETLKELEYIDTLQDPRYKENECTGIVINKVIPGETQKQLDVLFQKVKLCCKNYKYQYDFTGEDVTITEIDNCDYVEGDEIAGVYKLIYKPQGGTECNPGVVIKSQREEWGPLCETTKENYVFKGWNTKKNGNGSTITEHTLVGDKDINAYAIWNALYTLKYSEEGGTVCNPKEIEKEKGEKWGDLCSTEKAGYQFMGWYTKKDGKGSQITQDTTANKNITAYAYWKSYYTLTFDTDGGTACNPSTITKAEDEKWGTLCTNTTKTGYELDGWYDGSSKVTENTKANGSITVKAKWKKKKYTLTYESDGGSKCKPASVTKEYNDTWGELCTPTKDGYSFTGWYNGSTQITSTSTVTSDITVKAGWTKENYTLTYNSDGGSACNPATITKPYNTEWGTLCSPTKTGYTFDGWFNDSKQVDAQTKATGNITVKAKWKIKSYKLSYVDNEGTGCSSQTITKNFGEKWGDLCTPTRNGYKFVGWKSGSTTITKDSLVESDITVTAQWTTNSYKLGYNDNNGTGCSSETITKKYGEKWGDLCTPTRTGYTFNGWKNGSTSITKDTLATGNITITAQWKINSYKLSYNDNSGTGCSSQTITKNYGEKWGDLCTPTRSGYKFTGWKNGTTAITKDTLATGNITVKAQWEALTQYTYKGKVRLEDSNGKIISDYDQNVSCKTYNSSCTVTPSSKYISTRSGRLVKMSSDTLTLNTTSTKTFYYNTAFTKTYYKTDSDNGLNARKNPGSGSTWVEALNIGHSFKVKKFAYNSDSACPNYIWAYGQSSEEGWSGWVCSYYLY